MKCDECKNYGTDECKYCFCNPGFSNKYIPKALKEGECQCISCHGVFTDKIFQFKDNQKSGVCFNCY